MTGLGESDVVVLAGLAKAESLEVELKMAVELLREAYDFGHADKCPEGDSYWHFRVEEFLMKHVKAEK